MTALTVGIFVSSELLPSVGRVRPAVGRFSVHFPSADTAREISTGKIYQHYIDASCGFPVVFPRILPEVLKMANCFSQCAVCSCHQIVRTLASILKCFYSACSIKEMDFTFCLQCELILLFYAVF